MDSFELNKIVGAILGTLLLVMGVGFLAEAIYTPISDRGQGYALPEPEGGGHGAEPDVVVEVVPLGILLASASAENGAKVAKKCASCHNFEQGAGNKTGPVLYDMIGATIGTNSDYAYSGVFGELAAAGETWTYEAMYEFLKSPKAFAPGTKMTFAGLRSGKDRVNLLAYMQTLSANPVPFPVVDETVPDAETTSDATAAH